MNTGTDHTADYKALSVLTSALIGGIVLFSLIAVLIHFLQGPFVRDENSAETAFAVLLLIAVVVIIGARWIYNKRVKALMETNQTSKEKLDLFRVITITHMALCEIPAFLSIIALLIFGNLLLFLPVAIGLIEMILKFPSQQRIDSAVNSGTL
jgi:hypothetical protein